MSGHGSPSTPTVDVALLAGFQFRCLPGCGLCCYATPAVSRGEVARLLSIAPGVECLRGEGEYSFLAARPDGGACQFLEQNRCRVHAARPFPCREFPLTVHVGDRVQASLVLSCPGVDLDGLSPRGGPADPGPTGLDRELRDVREELARRPVARWIDEAVRRRRRAEGALVRAGRMARPWPETVAALAARPILLHRSDFPPPPPPPPDTPLEELPIFRDASLGEVALREHPGGWEAIGIREAGGSSGTLGVFPIPDAAPSLTSAATRRVGEYLAYALGRDHFFWGLLLDCLGAGDRGPSLEEMAETERTEVVAQVVARGWLRARLAGKDGATLGPAEIDDGIRAYDAELLDRPTLGRIL